MDNDLLKIKTPFNQRILHFAGAVDCQRFQNLFFLKIFGRLRLRIVNVQRMAFQNQIVGRIALVNVNDAVNRFQILLILLFSVRIELKLIGAENDIRNHQVVFSVPFNQEDVEYYRPADHRFVSTFINNRKINVINAAFFADVGNFTVPCNQTGRIAFTGKHFQHGIFIIKNFHVPAFKHTFVFCVESNEIFAFCGIRLYFDERIGDRFQLHRRRDRVNQERQGRFLFVAVFVFNGKYKTVPAVFKNAAVFVFSVQGNDRRQHFRVSGSVKLFDRNRSVSGFFRGRFLFSRNGLFRSSRCRFSAVVNGLSVSGSRRFFNRLLFLFFNNGRRFRFLSAADGNRRSDGFIGSSVNGSFFRCGAGLRLSVHFDNIAALHRRLRTFSGIRFGIFRFDFRHFGFFNPPIPRNKIGVQLIVEFYVQRIAFPVAVRRESLKPGGGRHRCRPVVNPDAGQKRRFGFVAGVIFAHDFKGIISVGDKFAVIVAAVPNKFFQCRIGKPLCDNRLVLFIDNLQNPKRFFGSVDKDFSRFPLPFRRKPDRIPAVFKRQFHRRRDRVHNEFFDIQFGAVAVGVLNPNPHNILAVGNQFAVRSA